MSELLGDNVIIAHGPKGYKVENENGYAYETTPIKAARLTMRLLENAGSAPTEQLYCEVLSALQQKARLVDLCSSGMSFLVDTIDRSGLSESWTVPSCGSLYVEPS